MWRAAAERGEVRRVTWVCGDQPVLMGEVVDTVRALLAPDPMDAVSFTAGQDCERDIWAAAHQYPMRPGAPRLIVVRHAEAMRRFEPLHDWLGAARRLPGSHLLFVADEPDVPATVVAGKRIAKAHIEAMRPPRGHIVRCVMPNEADAVAWVRRRAPLDEEMARHLLTRAGGNLTVIAGVTAKLALFPRATAGPALIDQLCREIPTHGFTDSLLRLDKHAAMLAAATVEPAAYPAVVGLLESRLDTLEILHRALRTARGPAQVTDVPSFLVRQLWSLAKSYDELRTVKIRQLLAVVDNALHTGARDGILEALVALW